MAGQRKAPLRTRPDGNNMMSILSALPRNIKIPLAKGCQALQKGLVAFRALLLEPLPGTPFDNEISRLLDETLVARENLDDSSWRYTA
jgi:hypothetical protein